MNGKVKKVWEKMNDSEKFGCQFALFPILKSTLSNYKYSPIRCFHLSGHDRIGIQVKQSDKVSRNTVDNFETSLERRKFKNGFVVGFNFTRGANEEVARVKKEKKLEIRLITVEDLLNKKKTLY